MTLDELLNTIYGSNGINALSIDSAFSEPHAAVWHKSNRRWYFRRVNRSAGVALWDALQACGRCVHQSDVSIVLASRDSSELFERLEGCGRRESYITLDRFQSYCRAGVWVGSEKNFFQAYDPSASEALLQAMRKSQSLI